MLQVRGLPNRKVRRSGRPLTFNVRGVLTVAGFMCVESSGEAGDEGDGCVCADPDPGGEAGDQGDGNQWGFDEACRAWGDEGEPWTCPLLQQWTGSHCVCDSFL
jgi:hypothetical protein